MGGERGEVRNEKGDVRGRRLIVAEENKLMSNISESSEEHKNGGRKEKQGRE